MANAEQGPIRTHLEGEGLKGNGSQLDSVESPLLDPVERWRLAPAEEVEYSGGRVYYDETYYVHPPGSRLMVGGKQVMDTCEGPWGQATVEAARDTHELRGLKPGYKVKVLERGFGLGITGSAVIDTFKNRGVEYHVIELNEKVADMADKWREQELERVEARRGTKGLKYNVSINIWRGEAREVTRRLVEDERRRFNLIISDTYPLDEEETGVNDILDIEVLKRGLHSEGVFSFFPHYPGSEDEEVYSHLTAKQIGLVWPHFEGIHVTDAEVKPPEEYRYLFRSDGTPIMRLPVITCTRKR